MRRNGFTLVELMVVIMVIAVLASLLMVGVSAAQRQARTVQCVNNLKQLGLALNIYMDQQSGGFLPRMTGPSVSAGSPGQEKDWCDALRGVLPGQGNWNDDVRLRDLYAGHLQNPGMYPNSTWPKYKVFDCPQNNRRVGGNTFRFDYTYNTKLTVSPFGGPWNRAQCMDVVVLHDHESGGLPEASVNDCLGIHGGSDNFLFLDGHVETSDLLKNKAVDEQPWHPNPELGT